VAVVALVLATAVLPAEPAGATSSGQGWTLAPAPDGSARTAFHLTLGPGQSATDRIVLANGTPVPLTFQIYPADAVNTPGSGAFALTVPDQPTRGVGKWTTPAVKTLTVPGMQMASFPFVVTLPTTVTPGDYAGGVVALDTANQHVGTGRVHINVLSGVGVRIYVHVPGVVHPGLVLDGLTARAVVPLFAGVTGSSHAQIRFRLVNTGNSDVALTARVTVVDGWGRTVKRFAPNVVPSLLPGSQLTVVEPRWAPLPLAGSQHVSVQVVWSGGTLTGQTRFWVVPWALIVMVAILAVALAVVVVVRFGRRRRRRRRPAAEQSHG